MKPKFVVYPNPVTDFVNLSVEDFNNGILSWRIYDIYGRLLREARITHSETQIQMTNLSSGVYLIMISH